MDENKSWKSHFALFAFFLAAILAAGAYRTMQFDAPPATHAVVAPASSPWPSPLPSSDGEPPSNEIADYPQLD